MNIRNSFLAVLEAPKTKVPAVSVSGEGLLPDHRQHFSLRVLSGRSGEGALWGPFHRDVSPTHEGSAPVAGPSSKDLAS